MLHPAEQTHWYDMQGKPCYTVIGANGKERDTTLRDARKFKAAGKPLVPSVTTICKEAAREGLQRWLRLQVLHAALTLPKIEGEAEEQYLDRIMADSREQSKNAAARGTTIHAAIQGRDLDGEYGTYVHGAVTAVEDWLPGMIWTPEKSFAHKLGFGGKVDAHCPEAVLDWKTKEFDLEDADKLTVYDEHAMQLSAYRVGLGNPLSRCAIVFVSTKVPGLSRVHELDQNQLCRGWEMFNSLLRYWQSKTGYIP